MITSASRWALSLACVLCLLSASPALAEDVECAPAPWAKLSSSDAKAKGTSFTPSVRLQARVEDLSTFTLDKFDTKYSHSPALNTRASVGMTYFSGLNFKPLFLKLEYAHDLAQGVVVGGARNEGLTYGPNTAEYDEHLLRKAYMTIALKGNLVLGAGVTTSEWGLGLIANGGTRYAQPGSASFTDPRGGDTVMRVLLAGRKGKAQVFVAADQILQDDVLLEGDEARQLVGGVKYVHKVDDGKGFEVGLYGVHRLQRTADAKDTEVTVVDAYAKVEHTFSPHLRLQVEGEFATIFGTTDLAATPDSPVQEVMQLGGALRINLDANYFGGVLDVLYASGDRDFEDGSQNAFKADINYEMGLMLFRHVIAAQSARFPTTASDPDLSGYPNEDLDRLPTRGAVSNTIAIFPRAWWRPTSGLELYGGPLIALTAVDYSDPLNTKLAGGDNRNPLDAEPSGYLGTEVDLGLRYRATLANTKLTLALEGALFFPGGAFDNANGDSMEMIYGGRGLISYAF